MATKPPKPAIAFLAVMQDIDTDAVGPDCLKAAFDVAIDALLSRADGHRVALNWNSLEVALHRRDDEDSMLVLRAAVLA